jgi:hypothetical protein
MDHDPSRDFRRFRELLSRCYGLRASESETRELAGGRINRTYLVSAEDGPLIVQEILNTDERAPRRMLRYAAVREALRAKGTAIGLPEIVPTLDGEAFARFEGRWFHVQRYIPNDPVDVYDEDSVRSAGELFGRLRMGLAGFRAEPAALWLGSDDPRTADFRDGFTSALQSHADHPYRSEAEVWIADIEEIASVADGIVLRPDMGVIHSDEKLQNVLFRRSQAFALVDIGGFDHTKIAWSVGQLVRSASAARTPERPYAPELARAALAGYNSAVDARGHFDLGEALGAAMRQTANLALRFATDVLEERTFRHDATRYARAAEQHRESFFRYRALFESMRTDREASL